MNLVDQLMDKIKKESTEEVISDWEYINIMNFFSTHEIEMKRIRALCKKFSVPVARVLPKRKYEEVMKYLDSGEWDNED